MAKKQTPAAQNTEASIVNETFFDKYKKWILGGTTAIIVVALGIIGYIQFIRNPRIAKANEEIAKCQVYFENGAQDPVNYQKALEGDGEECIGFIKVAEEYSSTDAGNLAKLYAGICYGKMGNYEEAKKYLEDFDQKDDMNISKQSICLLGDVYANLGDNDKALELYLQAAEEAEEAGSRAIAVNSLVKAGNLYESMNQADKALECYQNIKTKFYNTSIVQSGEINRLIEHVSK